jgi:IS5 family transposase
VGTYLDTVPHAARAAGAEKVVGARDLHNVLVRQVRVAVDQRVALHEARHPCKADRPRVSVPLAQFAHYKMTEHHRIRNNPPRANAAHVASSP